MWHDHFVHTILATIPDFEQFLAWTLFIINVFVSDKILNTDLSQLACMFPIWLRKWKTVDFSWNNRL